MKFVWLLMFAMFVGTLGFQNQESKPQLDAKNYASAGPITGGGTPLRGVFVIAAKSAEEAKTIVSANPMVNYQ